MNFSNDRRGRLALLAILPLVIALGPLAWNGGLDAGQSASASFDRTETSYMSTSQEEWLEFTGQLQLPGGLHADIWAHGQTAYLGTWSGGCPGTGVKIVDIGDPTQPTLLGTLGAHPGTSAEDLAVIHARTSSYQGDILAVGLQVCGSGGIPGVEFWDVSDPATPSRLGFLATPGTVGVHELHLFQQGERVLALLAVPHSERAGAGGDFRIVDASDPSQPVQIADFGVFRDLGLDAGEARGSFSDIFGHSAYVSPDGRLAYVSYWDAGVVILDISEPSQPTYLGRTSYGPDDEGNAHSVAISPDGRLLAQADEVTHVAGLGIEVEGPTSAQGRYSAVEGSFTPRLEHVGRTSGPLVYAGRACPAEGASTGATSPDLLPLDLRGAVALVDRGECYFSAKVRQLEQAGAKAAIVANTEDGLPFSMGASDPRTSISIPAVMVSREDGARLRAALEQGDALSVHLDQHIQAAYRDWGSVRFFDISDPSRPHAVSTFSTPHSRNEPLGVPPDNGEYTVHNPVIVGNRLYASWFSDGVRVVDISTPEHPREVAAFVPPAHPDPSGLSLKPDQPMVWGVYVHGDLVLLSDMNFGLYVLRHVRTEQPGAGHPD